jgi:2,5-diamino-6-(ribosylamino)-4(3H)-pyrimidinone 5'-phosphate reductase
VARPHVVINVAATLDGKIDTFERRGAAISSEGDRARVDELRASVDAIMVGSRTLLGEDPRLVVRSAELRAQRVARGWPENPAKIGVISRLSELKPDARFLTTGPARIIIFTAQRDAGDVIAGHEVEVFECGTPRVDLAAAMAKLLELGLRSVLVEGGGSLNFDLLRAGLVDEVQVYLAPLIFGGASAPTLADGDGLPRAQALQLVRTAFEPDAYGGVLLRYKVEGS